MKKLVAIVLTVMITASLSVTAFAGNHHGWHSTWDYTQPQGTDSSVIGTEAAKTAALEHAGVSASDASILSTSRYLKHDTQVYKVVFLTSTKKYVYEINAYTGDVHSHHNNTIHHYGSGSNTDTALADEYIGETAAKTIALEHADIAESDITKYECKIKSKSDRIVYDVEFKLDKIKHEYLIDALTGDIVEWQKD